MSGPRTFGRLGRRWIWVAIAAAAFILIPAASVMAVIAFTDVPLTHPHYQGIQYAASKNLTTGYPDGTFRPENNLTRGQMATFLYRASGNDPATLPSVNADKVDGKDAGQLVAAGIHVLRGAGDAPVLDRWFNNVNGATPTISGGGGFYKINVGFAMGQRFAVATIDGNYVDTRDAVITVYIPGGSDEVWVEIVDVSTDANAPAEFYVMIY